MTTQLHAYINFDGTARQALDFYGSVFGATKIEATTFANGGVPHDPADAEKIMHGVFESEAGISMMISDAMSGMSQPGGSNISLSLSGTNEVELTAYFEMLAEGGKIVEPLVKAPWGDTFGMCLDKFGTQWMVNITSH